MQQVAPGQLSAAGQIQVAVACRVLDELEVQIEALAARLVEAAKHLHGAQVLRRRVYGVGPIGALAFTCWLGGGRPVLLSPQGGPVLRAGCDRLLLAPVDVLRGEESRQGPPILRWVACEAGMTHARAGAPDHAYYAKVKARIDGKPAALSQARKTVRMVSHVLTELGQDALRWA